MQQELLQKRLTTLHTVYTAVRYQCSQQEEIWAKAMMIILNKQLKAPSSCNDKYNQHDQVKIFLLKCKY